MQTYQDPLLLLMAGICILLQSDCFADVKLRVTKAKWKCSSWYSSYSWCNKSEAVKKLVQTPRIVELPPPVQST